MLCSGNMLHTHMHQVSTTSSTYIRKLCERPNVKSDCPVMLHQLQQCSSILRSYVNNYIILYSVTGEMGTSISCETQRWTWLHTALHVQLSVLLIGNQVLLWDALAFGVVPSFHFNTTVSVHIGPIKGVSASVSVKSKCTPSQTNACLLYLIQFQWTSLNNNIVERNRKSKLNVPFCLTFSTLFSTQYS